MNRALPSTENASHLSQHNILVDSGVDSIQRVTTKCAYQTQYGSVERAGDDNELSPQLMIDANDLMHQARRTWAELNSYTAFCEVPATEAGLIAIKQLVGEGINVRVTMLFGLRRYQQVLDAYIEGIEARLAKGKPLRHVASIASLSVNSIDALADPILEKFIEQDSEPADLAEAVQGRIANAINTVAHQLNRETFGGERFRRLAEGGARGQCLFVNCDHCGPLSLLAKDVEQAQQILHCLPELGIDIDALAQQLENDAVDECKCQEQHDKVLDMPSYITGKQQQPLGMLA